MNKDVLKGALVGGLFVLVTWVAGMLMSLHLTTVSRNTRNINEIQQWIRAVSARPTQPAPAESESIESEEFEKRGRR